MVKVSLFTINGQMAPKGIEIIVINNLDQAEHLITGQFRVVTSLGESISAKRITMQITIVYETHETSFSTFPNTVEFFCETTAEHRSMRDNNSCLPFSSPFPMDDAVL